jgi:hypothetical protein
VALLLHQYAAHDVTGFEPTKLGSRHPTITPFQAYRAGKGEVRNGVGGSVGCWGLSKVLGSITGCWILFGARLPAPDHHAVSGILRRQGGGERRGGGLL